MKRLSTLCLALTSLLFAADAQVNGDYQSAGTGNWSDASTWERHNGTIFATAPTAPDQGNGVIHIRNGHTVTVNTAVTADQIIVDAGGILEQTSGLNLNDGTGDDLTVNGTWNFSSGTIGGPGNAVIGAAGTLTATNIFIAADITNNGTIDWQGGYLYFNATVMVTNNGTFTISSSDYYFANNAGDGTFINSSTGTVTKSSAGTTYFGKITVSNSGNFNINDGILDCQTKFTNTGNLVFNTGTFNNYGTFNHNAGSVISGTGNFNNGGILNLNIDQVFSSTLVFFSNFIIDGPGDLTINNDFIIEGTIGGTGSLTINANATWNSGTIGRALTNAVGSTLTLATANGKSIQADITNNGTMGWQEGPLYFDATVTVINNGTFDISSDNYFGNNGGAGTFFNVGTITKSNTGTTTFAMTIMSNEIGATIKGVGIMGIPLNFDSRGFIAPGLSPGLLTINGAEPLSASSTLNIEMFDGSGLGTGHDLLIRTGDITLAGTLTVTETGTVPNGSYTIINPTGTVSGSFATTNLPVGYTLQVNATDVVLIKSVPLPLMLISFTAQKTADKKVNLQWVTTDEQNVSHFEIQRSADRVNYTQIAIVQALNSLSGGTYNYKDERPLSKTNHYRLRMVDLDASAKLSSVRMVKFKANGEVLVFPTVTKDKLYIQTDQKVMARLYSVSGALLQQKQIIDNDFIDLSHLSAGMYVLRIGEEGQSVKIIKQ